MDFTEETATGAVVASFAGTADPRLREILEQPGPAPARVRPRGRADLRGVGAAKFLTATGQRCDDQRQEFILLSDVLGVTMLVDAINHRKASEATESTVLGPFHMVASPPRAGRHHRPGRHRAALRGHRPGRLPGRRPAAGRPGRRLAGRRPRLLRRPAARRPAAGQRPGLFTCDDEGRFWFRTVTPSAYPIPPTARSAACWTATGRHPYRPAHIHFIAAAGDQPVTTHVFVAGSEYLDSDAVFAVKQSLIRDFDEVDDPDQAAAYGVQAPFRHAFEVVLQPSPRTGPAPISCEAHGRGRRSPAGGELIAGR